MSVDSNRTSRSQSPITDEIMDDLLTKQRITTPTRNKLPREQELTPVSKELKPMKDTMRKMNRLSFPNLDSIDSQDSSKTDSTSSTVDDEEIKHDSELYDEKLKNTNYKKMH